MAKLSREKILSYALGFVVIWFGVNEILSPLSWTAFVPRFLGNGQTIINLVIFHGCLLVISGFALIFNFYRRFAAIILSLILTDIVVVLILSSGFNEITVRDIGLLGMAIALALKN